MGNGDSAVSITPLRFLLIQSSSRSSSSLTSFWESRTSREKDWVRPPLKPSEHLMCSDVVEMLVIVQLCTWSGRPADTEGRVNYPVDGWDANRVSTHLLR